MANTITDTEFGAIRVKRVHAAKHVRLRIAQDGTIVATLPKRAPLILVKQLLNSSREQLRSLFSTHSSQQKILYEPEQRIGASHSLLFVRSASTDIKGKLLGQSIVVSLPADLEWNSDEAQAKARVYIVKALKKEAAAYLPRRLVHLSELYGFEYSSVRYTNAQGRWGSCSSNGTISLNIALMKLPMDVIDYILVHELCHTKEMNHSDNFWNLVAELCPNYKQFKRSLKDFTPYL